MLREFRDFIARGNVLDLAVAVIIGAAFATITTSLTAGHHHAGRRLRSSAGSISPAISVLLGPIPEGFKGDPDSYADLKAAGVAVLGMGQFATVVINFLILAFVIFLLVRAANRLTRRGADAPAGPDRSRAAHRNPRRIAEAASPYLGRPVISGRRPQRVAVHDIAVADHRHDPAQRAEVLGDVAVDQHHVGFLADRDRSGPLVGADHPRRARSSRSAAPRPG